MKTATPSKTATKAPVVRRPTCKHCGTRFRTTSAVKIYCTTSCQQQATKLKRTVSYIAKAGDSDFMGLLARECQRSGTLQVLQGHDVASLIALHTLYKRRLIANEYGSSSAYAISHVYPARGQSSVGLFHASNLIIAPSEWNRLHGTKHFGHGLSIPRSQLQSRHDVHKGDSRKETVNLVIRYLGEDVIAEFSKEVKLQPTQRFKTLAWLHAHLDPANPEHAEHLSKLDTMSGKALSTLKATLQGKESGGFKLITSEASLFTIFAEELTRISLIRPDLADLAEFITECSVRVDHRENVITQSELLPLLFDLLHGKELADVLPDLLPELIYMKSLGKIKLPVPSLPKLEQVVTVIPAAQIPARVLARLKGFAESLDDPVLDVVPVMPQVHLAEVVDPLPWEW
ncbi:hypothetical protein [Pseudomonas sp. S2.OTC.A_B10]|uniref:hypothetical protein n=1 Tax=Pseudomonas sp. S2.OTC.A_B10 TaxID=3237018 RepID=UPI003CEEED75